jgi:hypothetical protein
MICEWGEPQWNDIDRGKLKNLKKNVSQCHFVHKKIPHELAWARTQASGYLSHGMAMSMFRIMFCSVKLLRCLLR